MLYLDIFEKDYVRKTPATGVIVSRDIDMIKRLYTFNKDSIESYYSSRNFSVKNTNILSRILEHFPVELNGSIYDYLGAVENRLTYLAKHFEFTSEVGPGVVHPPYFFGNQGEEIIFAGYERFDAIAFARNWKRESCFRTLTHPRDDSKFLLPLGRDDGNQGGFASVFIDMSKLAIKYREFIREQLAKPEDAVHLSKNHFVIKYVLSTGMDSIIDHTLLNRLIDRYYGKSGQSPTKKHPFKLLEPETQVNRYLDDTLNVITSKPMDFVNVLRNIRLSFCQDASELLCLPDMYAGRHMQLPILASRLKYMVFLLDIAKDKRMNNHYINDWKRLCDRTLRDVTSSGMFSYSVELDIKEKIERIKAA